MSSTAPRTGSQEAAGSAGSAGSGGSSVSSARFGHQLIVFCLPVVKKTTVVDLLGGVRIQ